MTSPTDAVGDLARSAEKPLVYGLHSANLYGTERMSLELLAAFRGEYRPIILCPPGPLVEHARELGISVRVCSNSFVLMLNIWRLLFAHSELVFLSTSLKHWVAIAVLNAFWRRRLAHVHFVHGGASDRKSYGNKKLMNRSTALQAAVSPFVRGRLIAHGVREDRIRVVPNFLGKASRDAIVTRRPFDQCGAVKGLVVSRLVSTKRVDLLLDALHFDVGLRQLDFTIYGTGGQSTVLQARVDAEDLPVTLAGFSSELGVKMAEYDFLVHLCPSEPFGMVILEAAAAGLPVVVPDAGGVAAIVQDGETGFVFQADSAESLAAVLRKVMMAPKELLDTVSKRARLSLEVNYCSEQVLDTYRKVIAEVPCARRHSV